ncbi:RNA polymerase sigma factor [Rhizobium phage RHEph10]|uniref:RNA polymerase sigma factor n=1 Tax=Rhizobium phage RHEph10 TaxID=1220717 RepID=UPI0002AB4FBA|nr:RNA polymerase sigma factor [Rhizobium phage RHEph10]AGC36089.1 putative RNA polymerase sigma factor protein [Rhizobium phage RHEph10]
MTIDHKESVDLIRRLSWSIARKLHGNGATSLSHEDVEQELWLVWCRARDTFDPTLGVPFKAYLIEGIRRSKLAINRQMFKRIGEERAQRLDAPVGNDGEGDNLIDLMPSSAPLPDAQVDEATHIAWALKKLSERTALFLKLLYEQPPELLEQMRLLKARAEYAKSIGAQNILISHITTSFVFRLMDADRPERTKILAELRTLSEKVQRTAA